MKLQHLSSVPRFDDELVRLFDFNAEEAAAFMMALSEWLMNSSSPFHLRSLPFISEVNCTLRLVMSTKDFGISKVEHGSYECLLTRETFQRMLELIEPFTEHAKGHQWLYDLGTPIEFLFSPNGTW
ncbi:MAG TPA: hypothetical protein PL070_02455 [Flavobacteriales bacterium]|nr:hypothetical protein [Flavobacteriales bacterium]